MRNSNIDDFRRLTCLTQANMQRLTSTVTQMPDNEQMVIREVLESLIIKYQSRRWDSGRQTATKG